MNKAKQVRQIRILGILLLGVLATALAILVISPRFTAPNAAQEQTTKAVSEKAILDVRYIVLGQKAASLDSARAELEEVSQKYLANRTQFPALSAQIYEAAASVGIPANKVFEPAIDVLATSTAEGDANAAGTSNVGGTEVVPVTVKLSVEAPAAVLTRFLKALGNMKYTIVIEAVQMASPAGTAVGSYTLNLSARAFMLPPVDLGSTVTTGPTDPNATPAPNASPAPAQPSAAPAQTPAVTPPSN